MDLNNVMVADIETTGLLDDIHTEKDFHILSLGFKNASGKWSIKSTNKREDVLKVFENPKNIIVGHYFIPFDAPALEKMLDFKIKATIIDTLAISWYLYNTENKHGLEYWGEQVGYPKVEVKKNEWKGIGQWKHDIIENFGSGVPEYNGDPYLNLVGVEGAKELYEIVVREKIAFELLMKTRCETDVEINIKIWEKFLGYLRELYGSDVSAERIVNYLNFIMQCYREQERQKIQVDIPRVNESLAHFEELKEVKMDALKLAMPKVPVVATKKKPAKLFTVKGEMTSAHVKWLEFLIDCKLPEDTEGPIDYIKGYNEPNPNSVKQKKEWLDSYGWKPETFTYVADKEDPMKKRKVPQILTADKDLCPSVLRLKDKIPAVEQLEGISILTHRIGIFKGLLKNSDSNGFVVQGLRQLANSLRWQHSVVVNFPRVTGKGDISDGKWVRECLIAGKGYKFVQSDLSGIESRTSDHYTFHLNPDLIKETSEEFFDPHTKIAVVSNLMTVDEEIWFKWKKNNSDRVKDGKEPLPPTAYGVPTDDFNFIKDLDDVESKKLMNKLKEARSKGKTTNYASLYLVGAATLARNLGIKKKEAQKLIDSYWEIHWAVKKVAATFELKSVQGQLWILCPISRFWHPIRNEKDAFSVVNQSSAVYCFNMWLWNITKQGVWPILQTHDDELLRCKEADTDKFVDITNEAMRRVNNQLKLNMELACEVQVGDNFAETH